MSGGGGFGRRRLSDGEDWQLLGVCGGTGRRVRCVQSRRGLQEWGPPRHWRESPPGF